MKALAQFAVPGAAVGYAIAAVYGRRHPRLDLTHKVAAAGQLLVTTLVGIPLVAIADQRWTLPMPGPRQERSISATRPRPVKPICDVKRIPRSHERGVLARTPAALGAGPGCTRHETGNRTYAMVATPSPTISGQVMNFKRLAALAGALFCISAAPAAAQGWGAFALSGTGAFGWSSNYETKEGAEERAMAECAKHAQDCSIRRSFQNGCLSVALSSQRVGWAWSNAKARRDAAALSSCNKAGTPACTLRVSFCSGVQDEDQPSPPANQPPATPPSGDPPAGQPTPGPKE